MPVAIWAGGQDATVPFAHGKWLAANVPGAVAHLLDERGPHHFDQRSRGRPARVARTQVARSP